MGQSVTSAGFPFGAGSRTLPKAGKLGSGAFYPGTGHHHTLTGNVFGANWDTNAGGVVDPSHKQFGDPVQALLSTTGQGRRPNDERTQQFPRNTHFQTASPNKLSHLVSARTGSSVNGGTGSTGPVSVAHALNINPWETTTFVHGRVRGVRNAFRVSGGVNNTLPSDTAFNRKPPAQKAKANPQAVRDTSKLGGTNFISRGTGRAPQTLPSGFRVGQNAGILHGNASNPTVNGLSTTASRWHQVKRGAAG